MAEILRVQGRSLLTEELEGIRDLIASHPQWSRRRISEVVATQWNWRNAAGQLKDMATRSLLLKLDQRGLVQLPARRFQPNNRMRSQRMEPRAWDQTSIQGACQELGPLEVREVSQDREGRALLAAALAQFHYRGHGGTVGENLQYVYRIRM